MANFSIPQTSDEIALGEAILPKEDVGARASLFYWLSRYGSKDYEGTIKLLYKALVRGRIQRDLRFDDFMKEAERHAKKQYDSMSFDDDCPIGEMIEP